MMEELLELRKKLKKKKPDFIRQQGRFLKKIEKKWRKPKGIHSKMRRRLKGHGKMPSIGYGAAKKIRYLHPSGFKQILVRNLDDLKKIDAKSEAALIAKTVGLRKKIKLLKKIKELKIKVLNVKDIDTFLKTAEEKFKTKKEEAKEKIEKKKKAKEEALKKAEEKKKKEKKETAEEKEKREEEEKRKILEKGS